MSRAQIIIDDPHRWAKTVEYTVRPEYPMHAKIRAYEDFEVPSSYFIYGQITTTVGRGMSGWQVIVRREVDGRPDTWQKLDYAFVVGGDGVVKATKRGS